MFHIFSRFLLGGHFICLHKEQNEVSKQRKRGDPGGQLTSYVGGFKSHDSRASTCSSLGSSKSWLRHPCFEVYRKISLKLLKSHLIVILGLKLHVNRFSLARATGPFPSNGSFCLVQRGRPVKPSRESSLHDPTQSAECLLHCEPEDSENYLEHVAIQICYLKSIAVKW